MFHSLFSLLVARKMKKKEKQKRRRAYEPKLTPEGNFKTTYFSTVYILCFVYKIITYKFLFLPEMMDSSTFKRFTASIENILENLEDMDFTAFGNMSEIFKMFSTIRSLKTHKKNLCQYFLTFFLVI